MPNDVGWSAAPLRLWPTRRRKLSTSSIVYGLLYHVSDPEVALSAMAQQCKGMLLLETCVSFGSHEAVNLVVEERTELTQSFEGPGCRPTRPWIYSRLKSLFPFVYVPTTQPAHEEFPLDWTSPPPDVSRLTRSVFIASRQPITNELLLDYLPNHQTT